MDLTIQNIPKSSCHQAIALMLSIHVGHLLMLVVSLLEVWMVGTKVFSEIFVPIPLAIGLD
jgi:hypothetical protein